MFIHLDPRRAEVVVPRSFLKQPQLVLQVGLNMAIAIHDLHVDDESISCTLSFNRSPFWCRIPWTAVYALVGEDGRGGVWPEDVPPEIQLQQQQRAPGPQKPTPVKRQRPRLAAVGGGSVGEPSSSRQPEGAGADAEEEPKRVVSPIRRGPVAVPAARAEASEGAEGSPAAEPELTNSPTSSGSGAGKKPKREIPPYLRVIK